MKGIMMDFDTPEYWQQEYRREQERREQREYEDHCMQCCHLAEEWLLGNITDDEADEYFDRVGDNLISWAEYIVDTT